MSVFAFARMQIQVEHAQGVLALAIADFKLADILVPHAIVRVRGCHFAKVQTKQVLVQRQQLCNSTQNDIESILVLLTVGDFGHWKVLLDGVVVNGKLVFQAQILIETPLAVLERVLKRQIVGFAKRLFDRQQVGLLLHRFGRQLVDKTQRIELGKNAACNRTFSTKSARNERTVSGFLAMRSSNTKLACESKPSNWTNER